MRSSGVLLIILALLVAVLTPVNSTGNDRLCESVKISDKTTVYCYSKENKSWLEAFESCARSGGVLSDFIDKSEHDLLVGLAVKAGHNRPQGIWLGGTDLQRKTFRWILNDRVIPIKNPNHFAGIEPSNTDEHCTSLELRWLGTYNKFLLNDSFCDLKCPFICKYLF